MRRLLVSLSAVALISGFVAAPSASAQQSVNFYIGGFTPRALDARSDDDVLVQDGVFLSTANRNRGIDIGQFNRSYVLRFHKGGHVCHRKDYARGVAMRLDIERSRRASSEQ